MGECMRKRLSLSILIVIVLLVLVSVSYAYFSVIGIESPQTISLNSGSLSLIFRDNDNGINQSIAFGETITKKFTIENNGTREAYATISFKNIVNTYKQGSLIYTLEYSEEENGTYTKAVENRDVPISEEITDRVLAAGLEIPANKIYYYNLNITLVHSDIIDQTSDLTARLNTSFMIEEGHESIKPVVVNDHGKQIENGINLLNTVGTRVQIGDENFYVIGNDNGKVRLLSKYNLDAGNLINNYDTSQEYYIGYVKTGQSASSTYYSIYYSHEEMDRELERRHATLTYLGEAVWDEAQGICTYEGEEVYLAVGYVQNDPTIWPANYESCNSVYALVQDNDITKGTGLMTAKYDYGVQSKCNHNGYADIVMTQTRFSDYFSNDFSQLENVYENTNLKKYTDNYVNEILKRYGVYTEGGGLTLEDLSALGCDNTSCTNQSFKNIFLNSAAWTAISSGSEFIYYLDQDIINDDAYYVEKGFRPVLIVDVSQFE